MTIVAVGVNHQTADLKLRERLALLGSQLPSAIQSLRCETQISEAVLLSTCHRTEVYALTHEVKQEVELLKWLGSYCNLETTDFLASTYSHVEEAAVRHAMRVASGLDSMVLGEPQILGQMKQAYQIARDQGLIGSRFAQLFPAVFHTGKRVRSETGVGHHPISMAFALLQLAKQIFSAMERCHCLLLGSGEMIALVAAHFHKQGVTNLTFVNRTPEHVALLAQRYAAKTAGLAQLNALLPQADIVITALGVQQPLLGKGALETAIRQRKHRPIFIGDLGMPRNVEPEAAELEDIYLYNIDDLRQIITDNLQHRRMAAEQAEQLIELQARHYYEEQRIREAGGLIRQYRQQIEKIRDQELALALQKLKQTANPEIVLANLAHQLTNKIIHTPTQQLRAAAKQGDWDHIENLLQAWLPEKEIR